MRWIILITAGLAIIALAIWHQAAATASHDREQRFLQWETCVLNNGQRCGPQPVP